MFNSVFSFVWCLLTFWEAPTGKGNHVINRTEEEPKVVINTLLYKSKQQLKGNLVSLFQAWKISVQTIREMQDWDGEQGGQNTLIFVLLSSLVQACAQCFHLTAVQRVSGRNAPLFLSFGSHPQKHFTTLPNCLNISFIVLIHHRTLYIKFELYSSAIVLFG